MRLVKKGFYVIAKTTYSSIILESVLQIAGYIFLYKIANLHITYSKTALYCTAIFKFRGVSLFILLIYSP